MFQLFSPFLIYQILVYLCFRNFINHKIISAEINFKLICLYLQDHPPVTVLRLERLAQYKQRLSYYDLYEPAHLLHITQELVVSLDPNRIENISFSSWTYPYIAVSDIKQMRPTYNSVKFSLYVRTVMHQFLAQLDCLGQRRKRGDLILRLLTF